MQDQAFLGPSRASRSRRRTAASTCTSRRSGCTSTATRCARRCRCRRSSCGCTWRASAARSAAGRTCRSRSTPACSRCAPPAGEDGLQPGGVVLRPRPSPPGMAALRARREPRRRAGLREGRGAARRRRVHVVVPCGVANAACFAAGPVPRPRAPRSTPASCSPTTRRAGPCAASAPSRWPSRTRRRWTGWPRRWTWIPRVRIRNALQTGDRMITGQVIDGAGAGPRAARAPALMPIPPTTATSPVDLRELPGGIANTTHGEDVARGVGYASASRTSGSRRGSTTSRRPAYACRWPPASRSSRCTPRPPRWGRASSRCSSRSPAPSSASTAWSCCRPTPRSARPVRRPPHGRAG